MIMLDGAELATKPRSWSTVRNITPPDFKRHFAKHRHALRQRIVRSPTYVSLSRL